MMDTYQAVLTIVGSVLITMKVVLRIYLWHLERKIARQERSNLPTGRKY